MNNCTVDILFLSKRETVKPTYVPTCVSYNGTLSTAPLPHDVTLYVTFIAISKCSYGLF